MGKTYTCDVIQDPDDKDGLAIQLSDELLADVGWQEGDVLTWAEIDGGWTLTKKLPENIAPEV